MCFLEDKSHVCCSITSKITFLLVFYSFCWQFCLVLKAMMMFGVVWGRFLDFYHLLAFRHPQYSAYPILMTLFTIATSFSTPFLLFLSQTTPSLLHQHLLSRGVSRNFLRIFFVGTEKFRGVLGYFS